MSGDKGLRYLCHYNSATCRVPHLLGWFYSLCTALLSRYPHSPNISDIMVFLIQVGLYFHGIMQHLSVPLQLLGFPHRDCSTTHFLAMVAFLNQGRRFRNHIASVSFVTLEGSGQVWLTT